MLAPIVRGALDERTLGPIRGRIDMIVVPHDQLPRLRGAAALVTMPAFAVPHMA